jgi:hypothetical protein
LNSKASHQEGGGREMKVFWSCQFDTPGNTGRHFVRNVLADAIAALNEPGDVEEPSEREAREAPHLDHDLKGIEGSNDLAPAIFKKIDQAAVFVADVTLVGERPMSANFPTGARPKKLINSNVAIEYGFALRALTDARILMIQNVHYGDRDELPFDLEHGSGPIQFRLAPDATEAIIDAEHVRLRAVLTDALRPYIGTESSSAAAVPKFEEFPSTTNIAFYWNPAEALASHESGVLRALGRQGEVDAIEYRFDETPAFYLRLIPTVPLPEPLQLTTLQDIVGRRRADVLTRTAFGSVPAHNRFGSIAYEPYGNSTTPTAFTQLFRNGEIWGVTRELVGRFHNEPSVPMENVENIYGRVLKSFISVAEEEMGVAPPFHIEMGAVGLKGLRVSLPQSHRRLFHGLSEPIFEDQVQFRKVLNDTSVPARETLVRDFMRRLYDLANITP